MVNRRTGLKLFFASLVLPFSLNKKNQFKEGDYVKQIKYIAGPDHGIKLGNIVKVENVISTPEELAMHFRHPKSQLVWSLPIFTVKMDGYNVICPCSHFELVAGAKRQ